MQTNYKSPKVAAWWCVCMQMFSQVYCIYEIRSAREKIKTKASGPCQHIKVILLWPCVFVHTWMCMCIIACFFFFFDNQAQQCRAELIMDRIRKNVDEWMLKAKMVQKACGDWSLDKPRWEEWWTVAQKSAAFIPIFLDDLSNKRICVSIFFCIQTKETKQTKPSTKKS